jgi:hypothetical protein
VTLEAEQARVEIEDDLQLLARFQLRTRGQCDERFKDLKSKMFPDQDRCQLPKDHGGPHSSKWMWTRKSGWMRFLWEPDRWMAGLMSFFSKSPPWIVQTTFSENNPKFTVIKGYIAVSYAKNEQPGAFPPVPEEKQ